MIKIYLSGPIDVCSTKEQTLWRHMIKQVHPEYTYLDPVDYIVDFLRQKKTIHEIIELEKRDIETCDVLLSYLWKPSIGTPMEIMYAYMYNQCYRMGSKKIKIISVLEKNKFISPWIEHHSDIVLSDFHLAFDWIQKNVIKNK